MLCAGTGDPSGKDLTSLGDESREGLHISVYGKFIVRLRAECAYFLLSADRSLSRSFAALALVGFIKSHGVTSCSIASDSFLSDRFTDGAVRAPFVR